MKKLICVFIIFQTIFLTGCWNNIEVNNLAITSCIGIDKTKNGYLVSEQVINPKAIASKKSVNEAPVILYTAEGVDLPSIIRSFSSQSSRKIYSSHLRMVILGQSISEYGLEDILDYFSRDHEYRTDFYFVVAKDSTAKDIMNILTPIESIPGISMYNSLKLSSADWAPTKSVRIIELINSIVADGKNPVLTCVTISKGKITPTSIDQLKHNNDIKKIQYTGLAAFKKDKLVGWLTEDESKGYNYITGNVKNTIGYSYYKDKAKITGEVIRAKSTMKASLVNGKPIIDVKINVKQNIDAVSGEFDVSKEENKDVLNKLAEEKIKLMCNLAIDKAQKQLKTDIFGFGEVIHRTYPKPWRNMKDNWNDEFIDTKVNVSVKVETNQLGQVTKSFFDKEK